MLRVWIVALLAGFLAAGCSSPTPSREACIAVDLDSIQEEVRARGGWEGWEKAVAPFRNALTEKLKIVESSGHDTFAGTDGFLFSRGRSRYLLQTDLLHQTPGDAASGYGKAYTTIVDLNGQLKARNIDLILLLVPSVEEVYADKLMPEASADLPVTPQFIRFIEALLEANVEAVNLFPVFLEARKHLHETLCLHSDPHWAGPGIDLAAQELGRRLQRYPELRNYAGPRHKYQTLDLSIPHKGALLEDLPDDLRDKYPVEQCAVSQVVDEQGHPYAESDDSPVLILGDSYTLIFQPEAADFSAHVAKEIGFPVTRLTQAGGGPELARHLARKGAEYINRRRVIIWVTVSRYLAGTESAKWAGAKLP